MPSPLPWPGPVGLSTPGIGVFGRNTNPTGQSAGLWGETSSTGFGVGVIGVTPAHGAMVTDRQGWQTVRLPDYFESINRDPRVHQTIDGTSDDFVMSKVVGGVRN
ncbi:MAG: hypothetical protein AB7F50_05645 [Fimbriimonadaceae bacterium]